MKTAILVLTLALSAQAQINDQYVTNFMNGSFATNYISYQDITVSGAVIQVNKISGSCTNFVFSTNYTGTIQVGTNYFTVKELQTKGTK